VVLVISGHWFSVSGHLLPPLSVSVQHCIYGSSSSGLLLPNCSSMIILDDDLMMLLLLPIMDYVYRVFQLYRCFLDDVPMIPPSSGRCRDPGSTTLMMACCATTRFLLMMDCCAIHGLSTTPMMDLLSPAPVAL